MGSNKTKLMKSLGGYPMVNFRIPPTLVLDDVDYQLLCIYKMWPRADRYEWSHGGS